MVCIPRLDHSCGDPTETEKKDGCDHSSSDTQASVKCMEDMAAVLFRRLDRSGRPLQSYDGATPAWHCDAHEASLSIFGMARLGVFR